VKIDFTIENEKIKIQNPEGTMDEGDVVKLYNNRPEHISFFHLHGNIRHRIKSFFYSSNEKGVILSIQRITQNSRFEFESFNNISVNFTPLVESVQLFMTDVTFHHCYESPGLINRLDVYIPGEETTRYFHKKMLAQLTKKKILDLKNKEGLSFSISESLNKLIKELEKPKSKSLCTYLENFIKSVTA